MDYRIIGWKSDKTITFCMGPFMYVWCVSDTNDIKQYYVEADTSVITFSRLLGV